MSGATPAAARYSIGIDLGTTHSALSYVDISGSDGETAAQHVLAIPQVASKRHDVDWLTFGAQLESGLVNAPVGVGVEMLRLQKRQHH